MLGGGKPHWSQFLRGQRPRGLIVRRHAHGRVPRAQRAGDQIVPLGACVLAVGAGVVGSRHVERHRTVAPAGFGAEVDGLPRGEGAGYRQNSRTRRLERELKSVIDEEASQAWGGNGLRASCCVIHLPTGELAGCKDEEEMALASVFKVPILLEVVHRLQSAWPLGPKLIPEWGDFGGRVMTPSKELEVTEELKCIGSGELIKRPNGSMVTLDEACRLMMTISDNTATDMVFDAIGGPDVLYSRVREGAMGMSGTKMELTNKEAFLLCLNILPEFKEADARGGVTALWQGLDFQERRRMAARAIQVAREKKIGAAKFQEIEKVSEQLMDEGGESAFDNDALVASVIDNRGCARDMAQGLARLCTGRLVRPSWIQWTLDMFANERLAVKRIPGLLPEGTRVWHKTGTISGVNNDAGVIDLGPIVAMPAVCPGLSSTLEEDERASACVGGKLVVVVFTEGLGMHDMPLASRLIARCSRVAYDAYSSQSM